MGYGCWCPGNSFSLVETCTLNSYLSKPVLINNNLGLAYSSLGKILPQSYNTIFPVYEGMHKLVVDIASKIA